VKKRLFFSRPGSQVFQIGLVTMLIACGLYFDHVAASAPASQTLSALHAELAREQAAPEVQQVAAWAIDSLDHADRPFVVVDKASARLFAFDREGHLRGSSPVVLAAWREQGPAAAPVGRFVADPQLSARSDVTVWVHADAVISLHVPDDFYRQQLIPLGWQQSVAYVLPEATPWQQAFGVAPA
jgi:hypothetical protein